MRGAKTTSGAGDRRERIASVVGGILFITVLAIWVSLLVQPLPLP